MPRFAWIVGALRKQGPLLPLLAVAAAIRLWTMPCKNEIRDMDEIGYTSGGLLMWEGMLPGWRAAPAGPQTWIGWLWIAIRSGWHLLKHTHSIPGPLKAFTAIDQALFETYADLGPLRQAMLWISLGIALVGVVAAYRLGLKYGGKAGGVLIGGVVALLPIYVEFAGMSRSYSDSWMLAISSISCAATLKKPQVCWLAGILFGLAVASRIDIVMLAPILAWALWDNDNLDGKGIFVTISRTAFTSALTVLVTAPWLMIAFVGTLRIIAMARVLGYFNIESPRLATFKDLTWEQGLGPLLLAAAVGIFIPAKSQAKKWTLGGLTLLALSTMFVGHYQVMRYHGAPLITIIAFASVSLGAILNRIPRWPALGIVMCLLVVPSVQSVRTAIHQRSLSHVDASTEWIEKHVPPGTIVYFHGHFACKTVPPTAEAADAIWKQVANDEAWRTKLEDGFRRFSLPADRFPRAMSEDNLCLDRAICRRWFILGGGSQAQPRYDLRPFDISKTFGLHSSEIAEAFKRTGGVLIWRTAAAPAPPTDLGEPFVKWVNTYGNGTLLYISDNVRRKLLNYHISETESPSPAGDQRKN